VVESEIAPLNLAATTTPGGTPIKFLVTAAVVRGMPVISRIGMAQSNRSPYWANLRMLPDASSLN
jgi:hypothetical protein